MRSDSSTGRGGSRAGEVVGLIPAAGAASRVSPLPCSKEVFPVGFGAMPGEGSGRVRVVCEHLLDGMRAAGIEQAYMVLRNGKWDIPAFMADGGASGMRLAYVVTEPTNGVPFTLDRAYPFVRGRRVACGFPDIIMRPANVFGPLLDRMETAGSDLALALFPNPDPRLEDLVEVGDDGRVVAIQVKPGPPGPPWSWAAATWEASFTEFLHDFAERRESGADPAAERHLGHAVQAAVEAGLHAQGVPFPDGSYLDIGTPAKLEEVIGGAG